MARNQYPGTCYRCGNRVSAGDGHYEKIPGTRGWRVQHATCAIKYRGTSHHFEMKEAEDFERLEGMLEDRTAEH